jgi:signal transduction histidine kinase
VSIWELFPYPTLFDGESGGSAEFEDGSIISTPTTCSSCRTFECQFKTSARRSEIHECRFGMNYVRLDDHRLIVGILAVGQMSATRRSKSLARKHKELRVNPKQLLDAAQRAASIGPGAVEDFERSKQEALNQLKESPEMVDALAQELRTEFQDNLSQSHDFLQLAKLVQGYAETLIQEKYPGMSTEDGAEKLPAEGAIYFATKLMLVKMDALSFIHEINLVHGGEGRFQIHPLILKYVRIYRWQAKQKDLDLQLFGSSYGYSRYNNQAIGAVVQGLLDNMVKYSPAGSDATILFEEGERAIIVRFTSLGPRIEDDELRKIFLPGFRARAARGAASSGLGLGLAAAKQISDALDLKLQVEQDAKESSRYRDRYSTTFSIQLERV